MRSVSQVEFGHRLLGLLPAASTATAEGAWVAVVYAALQLGVPSQSLKIDTWTFVAAAAAGITVTRLARGRASGVASAAAVALAGVVGWMSDPAVRDLAGAATFLPAVSGHATGWLLGLAAWRGARHRDPASDDVVVRSLLVWVTPGLMVPWLIGSASDARSAFVAEALPATLLFVAAGLFAIGVTRLDALGRSVGVDWRRNRTWLALLVGVVGLVLAIGTPIAFLLGVSVEAMVQAMAGPVGAAIGGLSEIVGSVLDGLAHVIGAPGGSASTPAPASAPGSAFPGLPGWAAGPIALAVGIVVVVLGVLVWRRVRGGPPEVRWRPPTTEERRIALPKLAIRSPALHLPRLSFARARRPMTASEAYLALVHEFEDDEHMARRGAESPAAHARRLRREGTGSLSFDLLAADFALERYAGRWLTRAEVRRALGRWRKGRWSGPRRQPKTAE